MKHLPFTMTLLASALAGQAAQAATEMPSAEEMWRIIQQQQKQIESLQQKLETTDEKVEAADEKAEAAVEAIESGDQMAGKASWAENTQIGGYGELHYNNWDGSGGADDKKEIDFHRFVLYFSHQFNDVLRFHSELELEHSIAGDDQEGEIELEQAYIEYDLNDKHRVRGGMFLLPVGIINETHEPPTFYGVERNPVEKNIIPATWWAGGASVLGEFAPGWSYDLAVHEGLKTSAGDDYAIRDGRQKTAKADAEDLAGTARVKYTGLAGLELAASVQYQADVTQSEDPDAGSAVLFSTHAAYNHGPFGLRALYARWDLDGDGPESIGADEQEGFYVEPSWRFNDKFGIFARYNQWDNQAGNGTESEKKQYDVGVNFWPHPDVVLKADYQEQDNENDKEQDGFNLGIGYQF